MVNTNRMTVEEHAAITAAVQKAELNTSGEIVTIVADHSDRYLDVALWWSAFWAILALAALAAFPDAALGLLDQLTGGWNADWSVAEALELALAVAIIEFALTRLLLQWIPLRLFLTPGIVKSRRVRRRAIRYFKAGAERRTAGRTGILIYLSLTEKRAEIVADEAIHAQVDQARWGEAMVDMLAAVREGRIADGMAAAIKDVGAVLADHFPRGEDDANELPDRLIEL